MPFWRGERRNDVEYVWVEVGVFCWAAEGA